MDKHKHKGSNGTKGQGQQGSNKGSRHRHGKYKNNPVQRQNSHLQGNSKAGAKKRKNYPTALTLGKGESYTISESTIKGSYATWNTTVIFSTQIC